MKQIKKLVLASTLIIMPHLVQATPQLVGTNTPGGITGITGVTVNDSLYNVTFIEGSFLTGVSLKSKFLSVFAHQCGAQQVDLNNGLVAYYPLDGDLKDASGYGRDGINYGAVACPDHNGVAGQAYSFAAAGSYIVAPPPGIKTGDSISVTLWMKFNKQPNDAQWVFRFNSPSICRNNGFHLRLYSGANNFTLSDGAFCPNNTGGDGPVNSCDVTKLENTWFHFAAIYDAANKTMTSYINGQLVDSQTSTEILAMVDDPLYLGLHWVDRINNWSDFKGALDEVRIYNRALSASEEMRLYQYESQPHINIPHAATATAQVVNGFVVGVTITDPGYGYTNAPAVLIEGGGGSGATAVATMANGLVTSIKITSAGLGYTNAPDVTISSPAFAPWLTIGVAQVSVSQHVVLGHNYVLESCPDLVNWIPVGNQFTANKEVITQTFDVLSTGRYFRIREVP